MEIKTYNQAWKYLQTFIKPTVFKRISPEEAKTHNPLKRMYDFLELLGNPQNKFKSIQVSGTSGKGSTAYYISHILTTAGYKTGFITSPHLVKVNERMQINNVPISDEDFVKLLTSMMYIIEAMKKMPVGEPSYFEITMAMGFLYFAQKKVDIAVVEVGIEGKYDASNTLTSCIAVLTNIGLDHTDLLGSSVEEIAEEAVSIVHPFDKLRAGSSRFMVHGRKEYQIVVTGVKQPSVVRIVQRKCKKENAALYRFGKDFSVELKKETREGSTFDFASQGEALLDLFVSMRGKYQIENAGIAIETVIQLRRIGFTIVEEDIRRALQTSFFPGRFEIVHGSQFTVHSMDRERITNNCELILDGAHNPEKMKVFISSLQKLYPKERKIFVVAFKNNKDTSGMLKEIVEVADTIIVTEFHIATGYVSTLSEDVESIKYKVLSIKGNMSVLTEPDPRKALEKAQQIIYSSSEEQCDESRSSNNSSRRTPFARTKNSIIVVTGSLYLVGEVKGILQNQKMRD